MSVPVKKWKVKEKCPYCGKWFFPYYYKDDNSKSRTCRDPKCLHEHNIKKRKDYIYKIKKALLVAVTPENASICAICRTPFVKRRANQRTCGSLVCRAEIKNKTQQERRELEREVRRIVKESQVHEHCQICGKPFLKTTHNRKICGSDECKRARANKRNKERYEEIKERGFAINTKVAPIPEDESGVLKAYKKKTRYCLKCGKSFMTDVMWVCPTCTRINEQTYRWG